MLGRVDGRTHRLGGRNGNVERLLLRRWDRACVTGCDTGNRRDRTGARLRPGR